MQLTFNRFALPCARKKAVPPGAKKLLRIMKLTCILLTFACLQVAAKAHSQVLNLTMKDVPVEKVLKAIESQTDYVFFCDYALLKKVPSVTVDVKNGSVAEVLGICFKNQPITYEIINKTIVVKPAIFPVNAYQPVTLDLPPPYEVDGRVLNEKGEPLAGATITVKGTNIVIAAKQDGSFHLADIDKNAVLVISFIGYVQKELPLKGRKNITIVLKEDESNLGDIVVVGYGTQKRANLTGAVEQISGDEIAQRPVASIAGSLQGLLPGLNIQTNTGNPGENPDINIRGFNSLNGGGPLVLIDGIEGNIERINPADVESVTVLKDAASSAIYGARGAFGVILITTKKGKEGDMQVNYSNNFGASTPTTRTDYISDPYVYGKTIDAAIFGYNGTTYTNYDDNDWEIIKKVASGEIAPYQELQPNGTYKFYGKTDWYNYLFRKWQPTSNHNISISGGTKKLQAYLSGRYYNTSGIQNIVDAPLIKYNLKANVGFQANSWLKISDDVQYNTSKQKEYGGYKTSFGGIWSNTTWYNLFAFHPSEIDGVPFDWAGGGAQGALQDASNWQQFYSEQLINTLSAILTPLKGLEINLSYSNRINHIANSTRLNQFDILTGDKANLITTGVNRLTESRNRNYYKALNLYGTYTRDFGDHHFKLMGGYNQEDYESDNILAEQGDLLFNDLANLNLGTNLLRADGSASVWAVQGYFGRFNYDFKRRYLLEVNARYDGSSRFPSYSRWGFFPSVSAGWYLSREKFWQPIRHVVNSFKLRGSYGELGNQNVDLYTFSQILGLGQSSWLVNGTRINYAGLPAPLPSTVSWETTRTVDLGADVSFLSNRLNFSFDWYQKNTSGMYLPGEPLPAVFGASEPKENIASLQNRGFEASVSYKDQFSLMGSPLHFRATASVYNFVGYITKYPNPNGVMSTYWEGQRLGQIWGYHVDGQFQSDEEAQQYQASFSSPSKNLGQVYKYIINTVQNSQWKGLHAGDIKYVDLDGDGSIDKGNYTLDDHGDIRPIGNAMPQFPFGFSISADWKGFDLSIAGTGVARQDWYPTGDIYWGTYERPYLSFIRKDLITNAWTPEHPKNTYPQIYRGYASLGAQRSLGEVNDYYLTNVGYLRIRNLTLGYSLPQHLLSRINVKGLRFYFSGENLFTFRFSRLTHYIDPEMAGSGINYNDPGNAVSRARLEDWPITKTISGGVSITL